MADPDRREAAREGTIDRLTWVGHSTLLVESGDYRLITDPLLTGRVAHLRRRCPPPATDAGDVDAVLISHAHMDHLHLPSLRRVRPTALVIAPAGAGRLIRSAGFTNVREVRAGDSVEAGPFTIEVVEAVHKSGRGPHSKVEAQPVGFVIDGAGQRVYYAGDTDLFPGMDALDGIDVAALPIWGWGKTIGTGHLDPARATQATRLIRPRLVVPIHWGSYTPVNGRSRLPTWIEQPVEQFEASLSEADERQRLARLDPGGALDLRRWTETA